MFKKFISLFFVCLLLTVTVYADTEIDQKPTVTSSAFVLYNPDNNEIVDSKNATVKMFPASLTKMLTALTVLDACEDITKEKVTVSENAVKTLYGTSSSRAYIKIGEEFTAEQLLYLMLLPSGNDAANALAEHFCGNNTSFAEKMNQKANEIGMTASNFVNPHGLHDDNHYTTAKDLAILADAFMQNKILFNIAQCIEYTVPATNKQGERVIRTTNYMKIPQNTYYYEYATGLKTGNTDKAGRCLAASAEKNGVKYICILLDTPEKWGRYGYIRTDFQEAASVFKYAFETYECVKIADEGTVVSNLPVFETFSKTADLVLENNVYATLPKGTDLSKLKIDYTPEKLVEDTFLYSPVNSGDNFGKAKLILDNRVVGECCVVAKNDVKPSGLIVFWHKIDLYVYIVLGVIIFLIFTFVVLIIRKKIILYRRKKAKEKRLERRRLMQEQFEKQAPYNYFKMD